MKIPNGSYRARAIDSKLGQTKNGGTEIAIAFQLLDEAWAGTVLTGYVYFTENTDDEINFKQLEAAGWDGEGLDKSPLPGLGSCECSVQVVNETFEGKERTKVKGIYKIGPVTNATPMNPAQAAAFAAKMRAKIAARKAKNGNGSAGKSDDIPF